MTKTSVKPGVALVGTYGAGPKVNASTTIFFYGDDAEARARASEQRWRDWAVHFVSANR